MGFDYLIALVPTTGATMVLFAYLVVTEVHVCSPLLASGEITTYNDITHKHIT
jgi:hypothetical protein